MSVSVGDGATVKTWVCHVDGNDCILLCSVSLLYLVVLEVWLCKEKKNCCFWLQLPSCSFSVIYTKRRASVSIQSFSLVSSTDSVIQYEVAQELMSLRITDDIHTLHLKKWIKQKTSDHVFWICLCCFLWATIWPNGAMSIINLYFTYNSYCYTLTYNYIQILIFVLKCCLD